MVRTCGTTGKYLCRMLKKARLLTRPTLTGISPSQPESDKADSSPWDAPFRGQGRNERRAEEVQTALRVGRSPLQWVLANGKAPQGFRHPSGSLRYVEPLREARTPHGKRRVSARRGWAGEKSDFFSILLSSPVSVRPRLQDNIESPSAGTDDPLKRAEFVAIVLRVFVAADC